MQSRGRSIALVFLVGLLAAPLAGGQSGTVVSQRTITRTTPGLGGAFSSGDFYFGSASSALGDLDGDGFGDLAVGVLDQGPDGVHTGAVYVLFLDAAGAASYRRIRTGESGFVGPLTAGFFGAALCTLDVDQDGIVDLAVGSPSETEGGNAYQGAVWILFLAADGTVRDERRIAATSAFGGLHPDDGFGSGLASPGDLDGDGVPELAVGAPGDGEGALWVLFLEVDGTVKAEQKIDDTVGGLDVQFSPLEGFGSSVSALGDLDRDGIVDLALGSHVQLGRVWVLFLEPPGTVRAWHRIGGGPNGDLAGLIDVGDDFGISVAPLGDLDGDGSVDLVVGARRDDVFASFPQDEGAIWVLFLDPDGSPHAHRRITESSEGFSGPLDPEDYFGASLALLGDLDGDGMREIAVGATQADNGGTSSAGALWILSLAGDLIPPTLACPPSVLALDRKGSPAGEFVIFTVTASDDADPAPTVTCVPPSGSFFPRGTTIVTCTATDEAGNQAVCTFPLTVEPTARAR